jgi:Asp-tRNA(Asn)/Glu-tRNA(Gln) amidotransferase A subunit family amidase
MTTSSQDLTPAPFLEASKQFASGKDTPSAFLERCLVTFAKYEKNVGAFVHYDLDGARASARLSDARWKAGKPLSPIDGMPVGIKDIIETQDMPTEQGSPLFVGYRTARDAASVSALREAGAVLVGKTVTTEFAASEPRGTKNPWDITRTPGGSSSGSAAAVGSGMLSAGLGTQVIGSILRPASFCGCVGFKPSVGAINRGGSYDGFSQSCTGVLGASVSDTWQVAYEIALRVGGDPGFSPLIGPAQPPAAKQPRRLALLETAGWSVASQAAKDALLDVRVRLQKAGVEILDRRESADIQALEDAIVSARQLSMDINAFEGRWPLNTYRDRDASKLSQSALGRLAQAEKMTAAEYRVLLAERMRVRGIYAELSAQFDGCILLAAPGAAPVGLGSTGDPSFVVPFSLLGVPALSLPLLREQNLPLGLQVTGFEGRDADLFALAAWLIQKLDK